MQRPRILYPALVTVSLAACGGDGQQHVASAPSPPSSQQIVVGESLGPTPALTSGSYEVIGVSQSSDSSGTQIKAEKLAAGALRISVDSATNRYTLTFDAAAFAGLTPANGMLAYTLADERYGHKFDQQTYTDGKPSGVYHGEGRGGSTVRHSSETGDPKSTQFLSLVGQRHVSLGQWDWWTADSKERGSVMFVYGDRTPVGAIPAFGKATYKMTEFIGLGYDESNVFDVTLNADFGVRSIGADVDYNSSRPEGVAYRTELSGSGLISSAGDFSMALNGAKQTGKLDVLGTFTPNAGPVVSVPEGSLAGAFFGPNASEIGGTMLLPDPTGTTFTLAFAASKN